MLVAEQGVAEAQALRPALTEFVLAALRSGLGGQGDRALL
jgi:hypothetical protein